MIEIEKVFVDDKEMDFVVSSDDEIERDKFLLENDTVDLTKVVEYVKNIESSESNG